jgi:RNA polymerase sigma factor (sigma-70 family)
MAEAGAADDDATQAARRAVDAVWRRESGKIVAAVARLLRDIGLAEEVAQDALVAALEHWPRDGVPDNPAAWLTATAKHRALDHLRAWAMRARKHDEIARDDQALGRAVVPDFVDALDERRADEIGDNLLRLIYTACHPVLPTDGRVALTLRLLGGLTTAEIARAFLLPEPTIAQRIVRAKRTLAAAKVPFELPPAALRGERLASVLEVVYLVFNEGYTATAGGDWMRPALADEALRLGRVLAGLLPDEPEVLGLAALMELQASRAAARTDAAGRPVLLADQDRGRWDRLLIQRGLATLARAEAQVFGAGGLPGPYLLQAAIAACHARAPRAEATDWRRIVGLYELLLQRQPSPVVALNRAVAVAMAEGAAAALPLVDALAADRALRGYPWLPAVRGDLLARLGRSDEARAEFERAAAWTANERERALLLERAAGLAGR